MMFRVNQKVVCVKRDAWVGSAFGDESFPQFGKIYTVREVDADGDIGWLRLAEIINPLHSYRGDGLLTEACFLADRFRPIVNHKTDIGFAHEILRKATRKRSVDA